jgi:hypothetical protein
MSALSDFMDASDAGKLDMFEESHTRMIKAEALVTEFLTVSKAVLSALNSHQAYDKDLRPELRVVIAKAEGRLT